MWLTNVTPLVVTTAVTAYCVCGNGAAIGMLMLNGID